MYELSERFDISEQASPHNRSTKSELLDRALQLAWEETQSSPHKEVTSQRYSFFYDIENDRASIQVYTNYCYGNTKTLGEDLYEYELDGWEKTP